MKKSGLQEKLWPMATVGGGGGEAPAAPIPLFSPADAGVDATPEPGEAPPGGGHHGCDDAVFTAEGRCAVLVTSVDIGQHILK